MLAEKGLSRRLKGTPTTPGVYLFRDSQGEVLYVGKAASLRNRLRSYFGSPSGLAPKVRQMVSRAADFEFIVTKSEGEALILENNLIKKYRPPYNVRLRDDKTYPYLKIDLSEDFPQVYVTRRVHQDGARYFGPFASAGSIRKTMDLLKKLFPYRSCTKVITGKDPRPCLEYYIHRCAGPCIGAINKEEYHQIIQQVIKFLEGNTEEVVKELEEKMLQASDALEFERAAILRDQIRAIEKVGESQRVRVSSMTLDDLDVIALAEANDRAWVEVFFIRKGKLVGRDNFIMEGTQDNNPRHVLSQFVKQFYDSASYVPPRIVLQHSLEDQSLIEKWLSQREGKKVSLEVGRRGDKLQLVKMVAENAQQGLEQMKLRWLSNNDALGQAMAELQEQLNLPRQPRRIECYDISNIQGTNPVGSMVVFEDGAPKTAHYRRFQIKTVAGVNDYAMMQEMLRRRFKRLASHKARGTSNGQEPAAAGTAGHEGEAWGIVPDLVLIDGGKGHLSAAQEVFLELGIDFVPLASIAKENEWLFVPQTPEPIILPRNSQALFLVQRVRDEAHRFAITYHKRLRSQRGITSLIDSVPGIGPKRKRMLLRRFGSLKGVREASVDELAAVPGMTRALAQKLKEYL